MSRIAALGEIHKLAQRLNVDAIELTFLHDIPPAAIRNLRNALTDRIFEQDRPLMRSLARLAVWVPSFILVWIVERRIGPELAALIAGEMPARKAAALAVRISNETRATICRELDPRRIRDLVHRLPDDVIVDTARETIRREDYPTIGRFVDFIPDDIVRQVIADTPDEEPLIRIVYHLDSRTRVDHLTKMLPEERRRRAILMILDEEREVLLPIMSLVCNVSYGLMSELGNLAAAQDEAVIERIIRTTQEYDLWADLLPVLCCLSIDNRLKVLNLPILLQEPRYLRAVLDTAHEHDLWSEVMPLLPQMGDPLRNTLAEFANELPLDAITDITTAALMGEYWQELADILTRCSEDRQRDVARIVHGYRAVDPELTERLITLADDHGMGGVFRAAA